MDISQSAYSLEFFNFTPEQISAERDHLVKSLLGKAIENTINKIKTPATAALLTQKKDAVMCLMLDSCQAKLDRLREMDKKTFTVPEHVLQIKDFELEKQCTSAEEQTKAARLEELKLRCRQNIAMLAELNAEKEKYIAIEPIIQKESEMHNLVYSACSNSEVKIIHKFAYRIAKNHELL